MAQNGFSPAGVSLWGNAGVASAGNGTGLGF